MLDLAGFNGLFPTIFLPTPLVASVVYDIGYTHWSTAASERVPHCNPTPLKRAVALVTPSSSSCSVGSEVRRTDLVLVRVDLWPVMPGAIAEPLIGSTDGIRWLTAHQSGAQEQI